jgi:cytochrome P450
MTSTPAPAQPAVRVIGRFPLHSPQFAADPHGAYREMRARHGDLVPVELAPGIPATLVIGYATALRILNDPARFPADPRQWQQTVPEDCPIRPMLEWRPNALRSAGAAHARYRAANTAALDQVDQHRLRANVEAVAAETIEGFCHQGRADLLSEYALPTVARSLADLLGCPHRVGARLGHGMAAIFEGVHAEQGNREIAAAVTELTALKHHRPGVDLTSRLLAHPACLSDEETAQQIVTLYGAGIEPLTNLITNTALALLTNDQVSSGLHRGSLPVRDALDRVLYTDPPMAAYCVSYPPYPVDIDGVLLPAHQPVVISMAAANNEPSLGPAHSCAGNRAHLAWSAGPHACPARSHAYLIAETALNCLLDALPEMNLAVPADQLTWRPGPFHRALTALPVAFTPVPATTH